MLRSVIKVVIKEKNQVWFVRSTVENFSSFHAIDEYEENKTRNSTVNIETVENQRTT